MAKPLGLLIDLDKCIGCYASVVACKQEHNLAPHGDGVPFVARPQWMKVHTVGPLGTYPNLTMHYIPRPCMHCAQASCIAACPSGAIYRRDDGIVVIDETKCTGAQYCIWTCPYGAIYYDAENGVAGKCDLCVHRIDQGLEPACVLACPADALTFGDMATIEKKKDIYVIPLPRDVKPEPSVQYMKSR